MGNCTAMDSNVMKQNDHSSELEQPQSQLHSNIREDSFVKGLLARVPQDIADSFTAEQLLGLKMGLGTRNWKIHPVDFRSTIKVWRWQYYYVFVAGRERRTLTRKELQTAYYAKALLLAVFMLGCTLFGLLVLYLVKSALGIDLFPGFSLGIWGWFKGLFL